MKKITKILIGIAVLVSIITPLRAGASQSALPGEDQIADYLNAHPLVAGSGGEVLDVTLQGEALVINLSKEVLPDGAYDDALFTRLQADLDQTFQINLRFLTTFKVEGKLLEEWGRPIPDFSEKADPPSSMSLPVDGPLSDVKIALSPGHGIYWNETYSAWMYQRAEFWEIREDTVNAEIMRYVQAALLNQGATVIPLRELDLSARIGISGYPAWHESARRYAIYQELPQWIWDGSNNNYNSDIRTRPYMANYYDADLLISLHNNGWDRTLRGTETYWDTDNHPGSHALANAVHSSIINALTQAYGSWTDRGIIASDSNYGEINYAQMPAILVELAFMDNRLDNDLLHQESFKILSANAITQGICAYLGVTCDDVPIELPVVLEQPALTPRFGNDICTSGWYRTPNPRGQYAYLAINVEKEWQSTHQAVWQPDLPVSGQYLVEAFIPQHKAVQWECPRKTLDRDTNTAVYEIVHANGLSSVRINQNALADAWVSLGTYHINDETPFKVTLKDITGETAQTTAVSASAMRFTLVGDADTQFYNTSFMAGSWLTEEVDTQAGAIRNFLIVNGSCLADPIQDANGKWINIPLLIQKTASENGINPKLLLAVMEASQSALSACPDQAALASLMGLEPASTARQQIAAAASQIRMAATALSEQGQSPNGWATGAPKETLDGVTIIPANDLITLLFDFSQNAGAVWGGTSPGESGVYGIYRAYRDFSLFNPLPKKIYSVYHPIIIR